MHTDSYGISRCMKCSFVLIWAKRKNWRKVQLYHVYYKNVIVKSYNCQIKAVTLYIIENWCVDTMIGLMWGHKLCVGLSHPSNPNNKTIYMFLNQGPFRNIKKEDSIILKKEKESFFSQSDWSELTSMITSAAIGFHSAQILLALFSVTTCANLDFSIPKSRRPNANNKNM